MYGVDLRLEAYESIHESLTGFKVYRNNQQLGTLEKRNDEWIGAVLSGVKVILIQHKDFEVVINKLNKLGGLENE